MTSLAHFISMRANNQHSLRYAKNISRVNSSVEHYMLSFTDGVISRETAQQFNIVQGKPLAKEVQKSALRDSKEPIRIVQKHTSPLRKNIFFQGLTALLILINVVVPLSAFEAHVLNVTATIKPRTCTVATFDTDAAGQPIVAGQIIDSEYDNWGLTVEADNNHVGVPDLAVAFGSDNPTGGDTDLGTPNNDFGGPGVGVGGGAGQPGENNRLEHNLLVIAQDNVDGNNDGLVDDPSDEPDGGWIWFRFDKPTRVESLRLLDIEVPGVKVDVYNGADILDTTINVPVLGDNSSQYLAINNDEVKTLGVWFPGEGALDSLCFDPIEKPNICDARSKGYWANNEGCHKGEGESLWASDINSLSDNYADLFKTTTGAQICSFLWIPDCPSGNSKEAKLCKARAHLLADELNVAAGHLVLDAFIAGADDGDSAFDHLSLGVFSTVGQAIGMIEAVLADSNSSKKLIEDAGYVAQRIYEFYEHENPLKPECVFEPEDVPQCLAPINVNIHIKNEADVENDVETTADTGGNSANGGDAVNETIGGDVENANDGNTTGNESTAEGGDGGVIESGDATSTTIIENTVNETIIEISGSDVTVENNGEVTTTMTTDSSSSEEPEQENQLQDLQSSESTTPPAPAEPRAPREPRTR